MAEEEKKEPPPKKFIVSSSPHLTDDATSQRVMIEVIVCMLPAVAASIWFFRHYSVIVLVSCLVGCVGTEWLFTLARKKPNSLPDCSAIVTALILGLSLPPTFPWWAALLGSIVAIGIAKMLFGGLGYNIFNPAMVGRAFLAACFGVMMNTWIDPIPDHLQITHNEAFLVPVSGATPLAKAKNTIKEWNDPDVVETMRRWKLDDIRNGANNELMNTILGSSGGSLGETAAWAWLFGGVILLLRGVIKYHIPLAVLGSAGVIALVVWRVNPEVYPHPVVHLCGGGLMMCAFFIATDYVTCPMSRLGQVIFGIGVGTLIMLIRLVGGYPEGVMYAILLMNAMTPLLDRWTRCKPLGGHANAG